MSTKINYMSIRAVGLAALFSACSSSQTKSKHEPLQSITENQYKSPSDAGIKPSTTAFPEDAFRNDQPGPAAARAFNLPGVNRFTIGNDIDVYLIERHTLPTISLELTFKGGGQTDRSGREGTAAICMSMLSEGTKKLNKLQYNEALADMASSISSYAGVDSQGVSLSTLTKHFDATLALYSDTLREPGFRDPDLRRMVKRNLESLKQAKGSAAPVANRIFGSVVFGAKNAFGKMVTEKSLNKIKISDCRAYHRAYIKPKGARVFVVGDITQEALTEKLGPLLTKWKGKPKKIAKVGTPKPRKGRVFFVDIPGAAQSSVYVAHMGPDRLDPEYHANQLMIGVLGGGFSSRINMNLREDKGFSYGARGVFQYNRYWGTFRASSSVRSDATRQSVDEIFAEMQRMQSGASPVLEAELSREKNGDILGLPAQFATAGQVLGRYRDLVKYKLPLTYYDEYVNTLSAISLEQVNAVAKKLLHAEDAVVLVVGDGSAKQLRLGDDGKDTGAGATLLESLQELAESKTGGEGRFVVLNADGVEQRRK